MKLKKCNKCSEEKPLNLFSKDKHKGDGLCTVCKDCRKSYRKLYYAERAEDAKKASKQWYTENTEQALQSRKYYREKNLFHLKAKRKQKYWQDTQSAKEYNKDYMRERAQKDPVFRLQARCRKRLWAALREGGYTKKSRSFDMIGCSLDYLVAYLEAQFHDGMTWENYGQWHVDHIVPLASAKSEDEVISLFHYSNLQPLWAADNIAKGARLVTSNNQAAA